MSVKNKIISGIFSISVSILFIIMSFTDTDLPVISALLPIAIWGVICLIFSSKKGE